MVEGVLVHHLGSASLRVPCSHPHLWPLSCTTSWKSVTSPLATPSHRWAERNVQDAQLFTPFQSPVISPVCLPLALSRTFSLSSQYHLINGFELLWKLKLCACAFPMTKIPEVDFQYVQVILANWGEGKNQGEKICKYFSKLNFRNFCQWL